MKTSKILMSCLSAAALMVSASAFGQESNEIKFPDLEDSWLKTGDFTDVDHILKIRNGLNKDQVALEIGNPHFNEGVGGPDIWNYAFNFYLKKTGSDHITCQFQVHFDENGRVDRTTWRENQCERFTQPAPEPKSSIVLESDGLFAFGRSGINDLQETGRNNLDQLARQILTGYSVVRSVAVVGHTDRIGSDASNMLLSQQRANTVKAYLAQKGVPANVIYPSGVGSAVPAVNCPGPKSPAVIDCLMPSRRVEVTIEGAPK